MARNDMKLLVKASAAVGIADLKAFYTWRTWLFGWLLRVLFQVLFYALLGRYVGGRGPEAFLLVGGCAAVAVLEAMTIVLFSSFDRMFGMLPLLVAAPGDYFLVLLFRNINVIASGTVTSSVALFVCSAVMRVSLPYPVALIAIPILALGGCSTYLFGVFLSALLAKRVTGRWLFLNVSYMGLSALCGFLIPVGFWPAPFTWIAEVLPFTHALRALRGLLLYGMPASQVLGNVALEALVAVGWFVVARIAFRASLALARRDGSIDLAGA